MPRECSGSTPTLPLRLELPLPPSVNRLWRTFRGRTVLSAEGRTYRAQVVDSLTEQLGQFAPLGCALRVRAEVHMQRRGCDADNRLKALQDALQHAGLFADDVQICEVTIGRSLDAQRPRIELFLTQERRHDRLDAWRAQPSRKDDPDCPHRRAAELDRAAA